MPASITLMCEIEMHMRKGEKIAPFMCAYKHIDIKRFAARVNLFYQTDETYNAVPENHINSIGEALLSQ